MTYNSNKPGHQQFVTRSVEGAGIKCTMCPKDALVIINGLLVVKCWHGKKEPHPNVRSMKELVDLYLSEANTSTLWEIVSRLKNEIDIRIARTNVNQPGHR